MMKIEYLDTKLTTEQMAVAFRCFADIADISDTIEEFDQHLKSTLELSEAMKNVDADTLKRWVEKSKGDDK